MEGVIPQVFEKDLIDGTAVQIGKDNAVLPGTFPQDLFSLILKAGFLNGLFKNDDVSCAEKFQRFLHARRKPAMGGDDNLIDSMFFPPFNG